jgi:hypothetical protein
MWIVILGRLVVKCLDLIGKADIGEARRVLNAVGNNLVDIWEEVGLHGKGSLRLIKTFSQGFTPMEHDVILLGGICQGRMTPEATPPAFIRYAKP